MRKRRILQHIFILSALLLCGSAPLYAQGISYTTDKELVLKLEDCIKLAVENNEKLKGAGYAISAAESKLKEAKAAFWPVIDYEYWIAPVPTDAQRAFDAFFEGELALFNRIKVGIGVPVFASGQLRTAVQLGKHGVAASRELNIKERESVVYQVKQLYYGVLLAGELDKLLSDAVNKINNKLKEEESMEIPTHSPYDLLKLRVFRTDMEKRRNEARDNRQMALDGLRIQMGLPEDVKFRLAANLLKPEVVELASMEKYLEASMDHRPDVHLLDIGVNAKKLEYKLEKQKMGPKAGLGFYIDIGRVTSPIKNLAFQDDFNDPFDFSRAGVGMRLSGVLDFHGSMAKIKKAKADYLKAVYERMIADKGLRLEAEKAFLNAQRRKEDVKRTRAAESMARQMMFLSKTNYEIGIGDEKDYTDALQLVLLSRAQYFEAVYNFNVALADLEQKVGEMYYDQLTKRPNIPDYEMFGIAEYEEAANLENNFIEDEEEIVIKEEKGKSVE
jgi:outer membrane protein TolC